MNYRNIHNFFIKALQKYIICVAKYTIELSNCFTKMANTYKTRITDVDIQLFLYTKAYVIDVDIQLFIITIIFKR